MEQRDEDTEQSGGREPEDEGQRKNVGETLEISRKEGDGDGYIDYGLRRRFVSVATEPSNQPVTLTASGSTSSDDSFKGYYERVSGNEAKHLGSASRRILEPEMPSRDQPPKSKKKTKGIKPTLIGAETSTKPTEKHERLVMVWKMLETADEHRVTDAYPLFVLRDFIIYLIFMTIVCFIALGSGGSAYNYYSHVLRGIVTNSYFNSSLGPKISFSETQDHLGMWTFIVNIVCKMFFDKTSILHFQPVNRGLKILTENILFGAPQLRQLRVRGKTCTPAPFFQSLYGNCADYYSEDIEDRQDFGPRTISWSYVPPPEDNSYFTGKLSTYPQGGFVMNFTNDEKFTMEYIEQLRHGSWIGFGTRAVFLDFVLFNPNTHLFCVCKLVFEFPPFGGVLPTSRFWTLKLMRYVEPWDFFILSCEVIFVCFTIHYTFEEAIQMYRLKTAYWSNWWNILDLAIIASSYIAILCGILSVFETRSFVERNADNIHTSNHVSFDRIVEIQSRFEVSVEVVVFIVWLKFFKFSTLNRTASLISAAIVRAGPEIIVVSLMMLSIMMGFTLFGFTMFGSLVHAFQSVGVSIFTMLRLFTGGIHWHDDLSRHGMSNNWLLFYCIVFFLFARVLFLNVFIALLVNAFEEELKDFNELSNTATIGDVFREGFCRFFIFIGRELTAININEKEVIKQNKRIYGALVRILRRHGYEGVEADLMLEKHKIMYGLRITEESMSALYDEMNMRTQLSLEVQDHNRLNEQIEQIEKTVLVIDQTLMGLMTKIDILTNRYIQKRTTTS